MPEFNRLEELAVAKAALACGLKPQQTLPQLKAKTAELYPVKLDEVLKQHDWTDKQYGKKKELLWTVAKSKELRPSITCFWSRWKSGALKVGVNILTPALAKWYNVNGEKPSGQDVEQAEEFVLDAYYKYKTASNKQSGDGADANEVDGQDDDGNHDGPTVAALAKQLIHGGRGIVPFASFSLDEEGLHDTVKYVLKSKGPIDPSMFMDETGATKDGELYLMLTTDADPSKLAKLAMTYRACADRADEDDQQKWVYQVCKVSFDVVKDAELGDELDEPDLVQPPEDDEDELGGGGGGPPPKRCGFGGGRPPRPPSTVTRPPDWDPGNHYFVWKELGPLGANHDHFKVPRPPPPKNVGGNEGGGSVGGGNGRGAGSGAGGAGDGCNANNRKDQRQKEEENRQRARQEDAPHPNSPTHHSPHAVRAYR